MSSTTFGGGTVGASTFSGASPAPVGLNPGQLFPTWAMPTSTQQVAATTPPPSYGTSWEFDFAKGDFVLDGQGRCIVQDGWGSWAVWCVKAVLTQRLAYAAYTANYGCDLTSFQDGGRDQIQANATAAITRALLADPRTKSADTFVFAWAGDALTVSLTITPVVGTKQPITLQLSY